MKHLLKLFFVVLVVSNAYPSTPTNVTAFYREGQTFITWTEVAGATEYRVYRKIGSALTTADLTSTYYIGKALQNSGALGSVFGVASGDLYYEGIAGFGPDDPYGLKIPVNISRYVITDCIAEHGVNHAGKGDELPTGTGLYVHRIREEGNGNYVVTAIAGGTEDKSINAGNIVMVSTEAAAPPGIICIYQGEWSTGKHQCRLYAYFYDDKGFNLYSMDPVTGGGNIWNTLSIMWGDSYVLGRNGTSTHPITFKMNGSPGKGFIYNKSRNSTVDEVWMNTYRDWFTGWSKHYDYQTHPNGSGPVAGDNDTMVFYTEEYLINSMRALTRHPDFNIDTNRVYIVGGSMGGAAVALMTRYYDFFASGYGDAVFTDWENYNTANLNDSAAYWAAQWGLPSVSFATWDEHASWKWGSKAAAQPIEYKDPYSQSHLSKYNGTNIWQWQNQKRQMTNPLRMTEEWPMIFSINGTQDPSAASPCMIPGWVDSQNVSKRAWACRIMTAGHSGVAYYNGGMAFPDYLKLKKNEAVLGVSNLSNNAVSFDGLAFRYDLASLGVGHALINFGITWACSLNTLDGINSIVDSAEVFRVWVKSQAITTGSIPGGNQTADITPRRTQHFRPMPTAMFEAKSLSKDFATTYASKDVTVDEYGHVTYTSFPLTSTGSWLEFRYKSGPTTSAVNAGERGNGMSMEISPNPFNPETIIRIKGRELKSKNIEIQIFDIHGKLVQKLAANSLLLASGITWDASHCPSGTYIVRYKAGSEQMIAKAVLLK
ncbi:MAG: hypothetical protein A2268_00495 [Candidatus Raymondbacteria bacterium RifOxyA12_full_50_37]|uniref:Secretion system C-terminal sorting domain-containing protein n=1 Tax=Candidatus Raymondbacteria bacterium RIFOXYD12_FULL_49_13 TaxID=1817890 RepID=A0A1F7F353_UNCRA|nr:MAG: hypothetical protein A2268_00495 [Candidatus Raymondbacteria bacterium RifOxyA12_full_50_37]OGJ92792.1 MAG: hypothetical protein A2248_04545 [Candidatus Raymondbacteria bacterium RIFOXYA2_FULL_49_16]OGJ96673.1 MAG: hypothetical protein A2487_09385 [Candidatus Raymondbacteria bacterium RifOxyC12_full_50_8]OGK00993.1 MAG: hypothetical protein A2519_17210 [Candidatus Raymondbacteria bacterium RIFOXYD12_FULL_49_13]OGP44568.1 MAG: hypothetical protein A2324_10340 [Candidatus Raymondbacteria 